MATKNNDPAFLFYSSAFITGCSTLDFEERGKYITLLCLQHQTGHLSEKTIRLSVGSISDDLLKKFDIDENGCYYNVKLELEIDKRNLFVETRKENGLKGGRPKQTKEKPLGYPNAKPNDNPNGLATENLIKDINKDIDLCNNSSNNTINEVPKKIALPLKFSEIKTELLNNSQTKEFCVRTYKIKSNDYARFVDWFIGLNDDNSEDQIVDFKEWNKHFKEWMKFNYNKLPQEQEIKQKAKLL